MTGDSISQNSREAAGSIDRAQAPVNFDAPAVLRKWPSLRSERRAESGGPYLLIDGTLDQCIVNLMAKPAGTRHLYEVHTSAQLPLVNSVLSGEDITELARLRDFL
jgi:5-keto 4-deoxyuronate isomerase